MKQHGPVKGGTFTTSCSSQGRAGQVLWSSWAGCQIQIILKCHKREPLLPAGTLPVPTVPELSAPLPLNGLPTMSEDTATTEGLPGRQAEGLASLYVHRINMLNRDSKLRFCGQHNSF